MLIGAGRNGAGSEIIRENRRGYANWSGQEWRGVKDNKRKQERVY